MNAEKTHARRLTIQGVLVTLLNSCFFACQGDVSSSPIVGALERDRYELIAEAREPIAEILVHEGQEVKAGELLVRLDETRFATQVTQARDRTQARLAELVRGPHAELISEARASARRGEHAP